MLVCWCFRAGASSPRFTCPPGDYLTDDARLVAEGNLSRWAEQRLSTRRQADQRVAAPAAPPPIMKSYEDTEAIMPARCPARLPTTSTSEVCGIFSTKHGSRKAAWKCLRHRPDTARSEYFLLESASAPCRCTSLAIARKFAPHEVLRRTITVASCAESAGVKVPRDV